LSRHHDIEQNQIEFLLSDEIEGRKTAFGLYNDTSAPGKPPAEQGAIFFDVINHQQAKGLGWVCLHHENTATDEVRHHRKRQKLINDANRLRLFYHLDLRIERSPSSSDGPRPRTKSGQAFAGKRSDPASSLLILGVARFCTEGA
jgi:hypothetical protein